MAKVQASITLSGGGCPATLHGIYSSKELAISNHPVSRQGVNVIEVNPNDVYYLGEDEYQVFAINIDKNVGIEIQKGKTHGRISCRCG